MSEIVRIEKKVLSENDRIAQKIRGQLTARNVLSLNLVSSPGSGKTSLLEKTLGHFNGALRIGLIAGDVQTENDASRLLKAGGKRVQPIVTGGACHLDAAMINSVIEKFDFSELDVLFIENVGNLVCPSGYDLGEDMKVVLISTTEGDDKPQKYPSMFRRASVMIINKTDLLGTSDFSLERVRQNALDIHPGLTVFELSCRTGEGLDQWFAWLKAQVAGKKANG
ncbi:MAG: hydrogenase nickel incorporation protein HypB [Calditrichia bacterium]